MMGRRQKGHALSIDAIVNQVEELSEEQRAELFDRLSDLYGIPDDEPELSSSPSSMPGLIPTGGSGDDSRMFGAPNR